MQDLRSIREQKRLSQVDLAGITGISQPHIQALEAGKFIPRDGTRQKLEGILGDIDWLDTASSDKDYVTRMLLELLNLQANGARARILHVKKILKVVEQSLKTE